MALTLSSRVLRSEGLRRIVELRLRGDGDDLAGVRAVTYDMGATFEERDRRPKRATGRPGESNSATGFAVEVSAYGDFTAAAHVELGDNTVVVLLHATVLPPVDAGAAGDDAETSLPSLRSHRMSAASARAAMGAQLVLGASVLVLGWLLIIAWPDGSDAMRFLRWQLSVSPGARLMLLAAAAGGLGALVQAALTLAAYVEHRNVYASWIAWYLLRAPTGMALGVIGYTVVRALLLSPDAASSVASPFGVGVLAGALGFLSPRVTSSLQEIAGALFKTSDRNEGRAGQEASPAPDVTDSSGSADAARDAQRIRDIARAETALRGRDVPAQEMYDLAERLRKVNEFGYARRLYGRISPGADWTSLKVTAVKVGQRHALATYKDPDLSAADRFKRALEILDEVDRLDFGAPPASVAPAKAQRSERRAIEQRQESLGLRGAVYKRRWQTEGQHADLERAYGFYIKGYDLGRTFDGNELGVETDQGYTGINAAFVLDLLAREDAKQAAYAAVKPAVAFQRFNDARAIRRLLVEKLPALVAREEYSWLQKEWWFHATLAEAHFGLGEFDQAIAALRAYNAAHDLGHQGPPLERISSWEFESTFTQLTSLALLQVELTELLRVEPPASSPGPPQDATQLTDRGRRVLREYLGGLAPALDRAEIGKLGLALSGGGFRASLFHIGVLASLAERDGLRRVEVLSCVSGGSIVGAHFYLEVKRLLETKLESEITRDDYLAIVERLERDFLAGVQTNIRAQVFASIWANLRAFLQPGYTTTRRLGALYERELYARVEDGDHDKPRCLKDLFVHPKGEPQTFKPKYDNWRRRAKVPMLVLNATTLNTGHNWQFTASWMGEPPIGLDVEIEGNYLLRRMYHWEAPRLKDRWRHFYSRPFAPPDYQQIRLGEAVAASSCVPGLFEPIVLPDLYEHKVVRLVDGGVHDNQGVASLLEQDCNVMIVSDASGQMQTQDDPAAGRLGVSLRSYSVSMTRVRQAQFRELAARERAGLLKGLMFLHLKRDLDADPVDWRECQDPQDASDEARPAARRGVLTQYGLQKSVQRLLSGIRTDLDSFTDLEAFSLMTSGYRQAELQVECLPGLAGSKESPRPWRFLEVEPMLSPGSSFEEVIRQLKVGAYTGLKVWMLSRVLQVAGVALLLTAAFGVFRLWQAYQHTSLVTVGGLGRFALVLIASLIAPRIVSFVRYRQTIRTIGIKSAVGTVLALLFKIHLLFFDPIFLRLGRLSRLRKERS